MTRIARPLGIAIALLGAVAPAARAERIVFDRLTLDPSRALVRAPAVDSVAALRYGDVLHRVGPDEDADARTQSYAVRYAAGVAAAAWFDANDDGDFTNDPAVPLYAYPEPAGARSFVVELAWRTRHDGVEVPVTRTLRVVLEPVAPGERPRARTQVVHGRMATVTLAGAPHAAMLLDGNVDGLYTDAFGDGVFVDLDDDRRLTIDLMSPEFGPFAVPFEMAGRRWACRPVDPAGSAVDLADLGPAEPSDAAVPGTPAPDFAFSDTTGAPLRLSDWRGRWVIVDFWASWCSACHGQAAALRDLVARESARGLAIVGVSYDSDRAAMEAFRAAEGHAWPVHFCGRRSWENPVGRRYRAGGAGMLYLVRPDGVLEGVYTDVPRLAATLERELLRPASLWWPRAAVSLAR